MMFGNRVRMTGVLIFAATLFPAGEAAGAQREVCLSGCAFSSIQAAIDASLPGDSIIVEDGTYSGNITIDRELTIESLNGPERTAIVGENKKPCVSFVGAHSSSLIGFSVQGGMAGRYEPSGIYVGPDVTHAFVLRCLVRDNAGAGIYNDAGRLTVRDSTVADNRPGPGMLLGGDSNTVEKCVIAGNENSGVSLQPFSGLTLVNSFVTGNYAVDGGGISVGSHSELHIANSTIAGNRAGNQLAGRGGGILLYGANKVGIVNSILWGNSPYSIQRQDDADIIGLHYSDLQDFTYLYGKAEGEGVIRAKPYFSEPRSSDSAPTSGGDYHLTGRSPCIDRGSSALAIYWLPDDDIDGQYRPQGSDYDMGADEYFLGGAAVPLPDIAVNSSQEPLTVNRHLNQQVYATIGLNPGSSAGQDADWWIVVAPPFPYPVFTIAWDNKNWKKGIVVSKQDVLEHVPPKLVFSRTSSHLPLGTYTLYFGIDLEQNGKLDKKKLFFDAARFSVVP